MRRQGPHSCSSQGPSLLSRHEQHSNRRRAQPHRGMPGRARRRATPRARAPPHRPRRPPRSPPGGPHQACLRPRARKQAAACAHTCSSRRTARSVSDADEQSCRPLLEHTRQGAPAARRPQSRRSRTGRCARAAAAPGRPPRTTRRRARPPPAGAGPGPARCRARRAQTLPGPLPAAQDALLRRGVRSARLPSLELLSSPRATVRGDVFGGGHECELGTDID